MFYMSESYAFKFMIIHYKIKFNLADTEWELANLL